MVRMPSINQLTAEIADMGRQLQMLTERRNKYIDGAWNQEGPEQWLSIIQIPIE